MVEILQKNPDELKDIKEELDDLRNSIDNDGTLNVYEDLKGFNFGSILDFSKDGIKLKNGAKKHDEKGDYLELNNKKFYDTAQFQDKVPDDGYVYYMTKNLLYLSEIKDGKFFGDGLQINRDKDITRITQSY